MNIRGFVLASLVFTGAAGCNNGSEIPIEDTERSSGSETAMSGEMLEGQTVSREEVRCYTQSLEQLSDIRIKSLLNSDLSADTLTTDETVRLARFYQHVAQECF